MTYIANDLGHIAVHNLLLTVPLGTLAGGYAQTTTAQAGVSSTPVDATGLSVTVTVGSGRRIRVSMYMPWIVGVATGLVQGFIKEGATTLQTESHDATLGTHGFFTCSVILTPSAGAHTYKITLLANTGTTVIPSSSATQPSYVLVEDIGV